MKLSSSNGLPRQRRTSLVERSDLLDAFERSGSSAAAFARKHGIRYGTFDAWRRQRRRTAKAAPDFVQIEVSQAVAPVDLIIELGPNARLRLANTSQVALAAQLLQALNSPRSC
jgi:transposase-like protein